MENLLKEQNKKYLPVKKELRGFSVFQNTPFAFYISANDELYSLNLETGKSSLIPDFAEVAQIKCVGKHHCIIAELEQIHLTTFEQGKFSIKNTFPIEYGRIKHIVATNDLSVIALTSWDNLFVISAEKLSIHLLPDAPYALGIFPNGKQIVIGGSNKGIKIIDSQSFEVIRTVETAAITISIAISPDGNTLLYGEDYKNIVSVNLENGETTNYTNTFFSKPIYFAWLAESNRFIVSFLSKSLGIYSVGTASGTVIDLAEFPSRYFQYTSLVNPDIIAVCVENLRTKDVVESIPISSVVVLQSISK